MPYLGSTPNASFSSRTKQDFTANGSTTAFTLSSAVASANDIEVFVGNVRQEPTDAYTVNGTTLTMSEAPATGLNFYVVFKQLEENSVVPADGTISTAKIAANAVTTAKITNANITQAKLASGVAGNGPSFSAYLNSNFSISNTTHTKLRFDAEEWDSDGCFDSTTNFRFTPNVAGYYMIGGHFQPNASYTVGTTTLYKNGNLYRVLHWNQQSETTPAPVGGTTLVHMNGSSDYVELYGYMTVGQQIQSGSEWTWFQGHMVRSA
jgi:hypothetical protein